MPRHTRIDGRYPTLDTAGVAVERYRRYVNRRLRPHSVSVVLLTCVVDGTGEHHMGDAVIPVGPGSVGITHYGQTHDLLTGPGGVDVINVYADLQSHDLPVVPAPWDRTLASILAPDPAVVHRQNRRVHLAFDEPARMVQPLEWMLREQQADRPGCAAVMAQLFALFLVECCRVADRMGWRGDDDAPEWVGRVRDHLDRRFDHAMDLSDLVAIAGVSAEHLCRRFGEHTGLSPIAYLNHRRVQHAMWLLRTTDRPITEVALASGFADISGFNRRFKATTGKSPSAYRGKAS